MQAKPSRFPIPWPHDNEASTVVEELTQRFDAEHERRYGHCFEGQYGVEIVNLRMVGSVPRETAKRVPSRGASREVFPLGKRDAYFGADFGVLATPGVFARRARRSGAQWPIDHRRVRRHYRRSPQFNRCARFGGQHNREAGGAMNAKSNIDPFLLEVLKNSFDTIADDMALNLMRSAYSGIIRDSMDFSTALLDQHGQTLAQGLTTPMHLGSFFDAMSGLMNRFDEDIDEQDVFIF